MQENNIFYKKVLELSKKQNKSLNSIERDLLFPRNALHNYKNTLSYPSADRLLKVAHYFNVTPEYLLGEKPNSDKDIPYEIFNNLDFQQKLFFIKKCLDWLFDNVDPQEISKILYYQKSKEK